MQINPVAGTRSVALPLLFLIAAVAPFAWAQSNNQKWSQVTYRKSVDGKAAEHRKFLETAWVKSVEHGVAKGDLHGGMVVRLTAPFVAGSDYDFAVIVYPVKVPSLAQPSQADLEARAKAAGFANWAGYLAASRSNSTVVRSQWNRMRTRMGAVPVGSYLRTTLHQVDDNHMDAVMAYTRDYTIPMNAARIKQGNSNVIGWGQQTPGLLSPAEAGFAIMQTLVLKDPRDAVAGPGPMNEAAFKALLPGKSYGNYIRQTEVVNNLRKRVRTRFSEVIAVVGTIPTIE